MSGPWPKNMPRSLDYPRVGADAILAGAARAYPERIALRDGDETLTYAELRDRALRIAGGLRERGIEPGDAVALHMPNSLWFIVAYYGALCAGAAVAPVNTAQPPHALREQFTDVRAKAVISHPATVSAVVEAAADCVGFTVCVPATAAGPAEDAAGVPAGLVPLADLLAADPLTGYRVDPELVAHLQLTGGTTGRSKAVRVLHRNLVANIVQNVAWRAACMSHLDEQGALRLTQVVEAATEHTVIPGRCTNIAVAPLFHGLGLVGHNLNVVLGSTVVLTGRFDPDTLLADIERFRVTQMGGSPAMYYALLRSPHIDKHDLSSVRAITSGAAPIDTTALRSLREKFPHAAVTEGYGLSEATMAVTNVPYDSDVDSPLGSVGVPLFDTEIQIRDGDGTTAVPVGNTGELWVRGPQVTDGYHGHPELTAAQFRDGWLATGDMGRVDDQGNLFLVGRSKDMILYKGYNVYPQPLEEILCAHPAVAQAAVVGAPSETAGEIPVAFVMLRPGTPAEGPTNAQLETEIMAHVATKVAPYQKIRAVYIVDALPLTPTGKILKSELRSRLGGAAM